MYYLNAIALLGKH